MCEIIARQMQGTLLGTTRKTKMNQQNQKPCPQKLKKAHDPGAEVNTCSNNEVQNSKCATVLTWNTEWYQGKREERVILDKWDQGSLDRDGLSSGLSILASEWWGKNKVSTEKYFHAFIQSTVHSFIQFSLHSFIQAS